MGLEQWSSPVNPVAKVSRKQAIQVPAIKRGRDIIAGSIGSLPFRMYDMDNVDHVSNLLSQPERHNPRSVTMTNLIEDILFEGEGWWWTTERDWRNFPTFVMRLEPPVEPDERGYVHITLNGEERVIPPQDLIRFPSPTEPVLYAGARAIRTWLKLSVTVDNYADVPMPAGYFTPKNEQWDPSPAEIGDFLDEWEKARREHSTGYIPGLVDFETVQLNPEQLQLVEARREAVIELSEVLGIDPEDLGISTTTRTYQNVQDRRLGRLNDTLGMYVSAVQERLSMFDITPRGYTVRADWAGFLRADDLARYQAYQLAVNLGVIDRYDIAKREGLPRPLFEAPTAPAEIPAGTG